MFKSRLFFVTTIIVIFTGSLFAEIDYNKMLIKAAEQNKIEMVKKCLDEGADIETRNKDGYTSFIIAAENGNLELVKLLVEKGAYIYAQEKTHRSVFHESKFIANNVIKYLRQIEKEKYGIGVPEPEWRRFITYEKDNPYWIDDFDVEGLEQYIIDGNPIDSLDSQGKSVLHYLAEERIKKDTISILVNEKNIDVNTKDITGKTPLHKAVRRKIYENIKTLIELGADVNAEDFHGITPLYVFSNGYDSLNSNNERAMKNFNLLMENGADASKGDIFGYTPLYNISDNRDHIHNNIALAKILLDNGADINAKTIEGKTSLHEAANRGAIDMIEFLLKSGADPEIKNSRGRLAVDLVSKYDPNRDKKLAIFSKYQKNVTFLEAVKKSLKDSVAEYLIKGCNINEVSTEDSNSTALILASKNGNDEIVKMLLEHNPDLDIQDMEGNTALHFAAYKGYSEIVFSLVDSNAGINIRNNNGYTAYDLAVENNKYRAKQIFKDYYPEITKTSDEELAKYFLEDEEFVDTPTEIQDKEQMLKQMRQMAKQELLKELKEPLHKAVIQGDIEVVRQMISSGSDLNKMDMYESTPLIYSVFMGYTDITKMLIGKGASIDAVSGQGLTGLHIAVAYQDTKMIKTLLDMGADASIKTEVDGMNALEIAMIAEDTESEKLIKKYFPDLKGDISKFKQMQAEMEKQIAEELEQQNQKFEEQFEKEMVNERTKSLVIESGNELHIAVIEGDVNKVQALLDAGFDVNSEDDQGRSALSYAASLNNKQLVDLLLTSKADINKIDNNKDAFIPWHYSFDGYLMHTVGSEAGFGVLHYLASEGNIEMIKHLLSKGADINMLDREHKISPLLLAIGAKEYETFKYLIEAGADQSICIKNSKNNIMTNAARNKHIEELRFLINSGMAIDTFDCKQRTALWEAAHWGQNEAMIFLIENGADMNIVNSSGNTALFYASNYYGEDIEALMILLEYGANVNIKNKSGQTALYSTFSMHGQSIKKAKYLIEEGIDINSTDNKGQTVLHKIVSLTNTYPVEMIKLFIESGIDVNKKDMKNNIALMLALDNYSMMMPMGGDNKSLKIIKLLIESGSEISEDDICGSYAFEQMISHGNLELVALLIDNGLNVNYSKKGYKYFPLSKAIINGESKRYDFVKLLIDKGADVNFKDDKDGKTPLLDAISYDSKTMKLLIDSGADINITDNNGNTILHRAVSARNTEVAKLLIEMGVDYNIPNRWNKTAKDMAERAKMQDVLELMN